jgi:hypothetical protein
MTARMACTTDIPQPADYAGCVSRFVETCRQNQWGVVEAIANERGLRQYAEAVREECAQQAARWGADAATIRQLAAPVMQSVSFWTNRAAQTFAAGVPCDDPRVLDFLRQMFRDVRSHQIDAAAKEASHQRGAAYQRNDDEQLNRWLHAEAALEAMLAEAKLDPDEARSRWLETVAGFTDQVSAWARGQNWRVDVKQLERSEELLGTYDVPLLIIQTERGAVIVEPVARVVAGSEGRIDIYAYPARFRVMMLRSGENGEWRIRTDSRVYLRQPWNEGTFVELVRDLTAAQ